jgi:hypothetical protein
MRRIGFVLALMLLAVACLVVMVDVHELAHTAAARLGGDRGAAYYLYRHHPGGDCLGCNVYDERRLGYGANIAVTVAGVLVTQVAALGLLVIGARRRAGTWARAAWLVAAGVFFLDLSLQVGQALAADVAHQTRLSRVDLADTLYLVGTRTPIPVSGLEATLVALALFVVWSAIAAYLAGAPGPRPCSLRHARRSVTKRRS